NNSTRPAVTNNEIYGNKYGVKAAYGGMPEMNGGYNGIYSNADYNVYNLNTDSTVRAERNWWGGSPPDTAKFYGKVDYDPWLTEAYKSKASPYRPADKTETEDINTPIIAPIFDIRPNPCRTGTSIRYSVTSSDPSKVVLRMYNIAGELIRTLVDDEQPPGIYAKPWDGRNGQGCPVASGIYVCRLAVTPRNGPPVVRTRRMLVVK
ncbi:MAG: FlgD immunoglobulin-like domain containing protein, partial [Candidatus Edwardsbacteria bacterium]|nr:FlgD immunoglobulin-like domain containing protein [Candidatus Edwardsbacteria bacterium]